MKRIGNLLEKICDLNNIEIADKKARRNKRCKYGINKHDLTHNEDNLLLSNNLRFGTYKTSQYTTFKVYEPKERIIFRLPYYPDRIGHRAIMNILEPI